MKPIRFLAVFSIFHLLFSIATAAGPLGSMATQNKNAVDITGGTASGLTITGSTITGYVPNTITINGHALTGNVTITKGDLTLGNVENTALSTWAGSAALTTFSGGTFGSAAATASTAYDAAGTAAAVLPSQTGNSGKFLTTNGTAVSWGTVASNPGTVTSAGWTGGIVSVATATSTPAFTIAGTSGGIPYFSSATTWASSGALAANALVIGGGAGAAPSTTTTGTGVLAALGNATNAASGLVALDASGFVKGNDINTGYVTIYPNGGNPGQLKMKDSTGTYPVTVEPAITVTASRVVRIPDASGTLLLDTATQTVTNKDLTSGTNTFPTLNQNTTGNAATATTAAAVPFSGITGAVNDNTALGVALAAKAAGAATSTNGNAAIFSGGTGKILADAGAPPLLTNGLGTNVQTALGSAVNAANGFPRLTAAGKYPALDGSLITGITVPTVANSTASIGLTRVNGATGNFMDAGSAPPLDVTIAPTWTGLHNFTNAGGLQTNVIAVTSGTTATLFNTTATTVNFAGEATTLNMLASGGTLALGGGTVTLTGAASLTGGAGNMTITSGTGNNRTMIFKTTTAGGTATTALTLNADQSATFSSTGGNAAAPTVKVGDEQTGIYKDNPSSIAIATNGAFAARFYSNGGGISMSTLSGIGTPQGLAVTAAGTPRTYWSEYAAGVWQAGYTNWNDAGSIRVTNITALGTLAVTGATTLTGAVGVGGAANANAILDAQSTTKAFMPPRMTTTQKNAIASPTAGMVVYDSTLGKLCVYTGAAWETVTSL